MQNVFTPGGPTLTTITVLVTYPGSRVTGAAPQSVTGTGWTFGSASASGTNWVYSFVWAGTLATSHSTSTLSYKVPLKNNSSGTIALTAAASATGVQLGVRGDVDQPLRLPQAVAAARSTSMNRASRESWSIRRTAGPQPRTRRWWPARLASMRGVGEHPGGGDVEGVGRRSGRR